ncbi:MAG: TRAP transporter large permease subunit [Gammaproteobacteria bacterium]|nr:TRAP transporter large permease subunit [Gammaproteobacteria bacterium]
MAEVMVILLVVGVLLVLMSGFPVAFAYAGTALLFTLIGTHFFPDIYDYTFMATRHNSLYRLMLNPTLIAVPLFVFMGVMLERSKVAEELLDTMGMLFGPLRGGLGISVIIVGMLLAASTGIVGATVVTMGLLSLPTMLKRKYDPALSSGIICASGTLGQIIPPSIILILLGDQLATEYENAQLAMGNFSPDVVSVGDLFAGALIPGLLLVGLYLVYLIVIAIVKPKAMPALPEADRTLKGSALLLRSLKVLVPPLLLIVSVLGSILAGAATPTEAASVGAVGSIILAAAYRQLNKKILLEVMQRTARVSSMVFMIFIGALLFSATFRGYGGDKMVEALLTNLPGGVAGAMLVVMLVMFFLGFILDFIEITLVMVPIIAPVLFKMNVDPVWLGVMIGVNLQTSFLTPPFGFSLFYLRGVAPQSVSTTHIYKGVVPFILLQILMLLILSLWPGLATWLPHHFSG